ncbi:MAG TPA: hypothetical protein VE377_17560 [Candidatus Dormibacteraeota bacterium]|nr:hypothetical protein [Candidatus Dormibacteraeota bacterium]
MRLYSASSEETLRARGLLKDWAGEGFLTREQYQVLEKETVSELRTTNIFLRLVLFFFTLIIVGAAVGLFFVVFVSRPSETTAGVFFLMFAAVCYAAAEVAVAQARLYRFGIEEALAVCSVGFLCAGLQIALFSGSPYSPRPDAVECLVPAAGAVFSFWIWHRFGLSYLFPAAMIFVIFLPGYWTSAREAQHLMVAAFYATGLAGVVAVRSRHRFDYLEEAYSLVEALLWLGIYLAINLQLSSLNLAGQWWGGTRAASEFARPFYWATWVLTWCLPPIVIVRGVRQKDRFVIAAGAVVAILTLVTNKPYLGWARHTWDPILLGILLTGVAVFLRRWLARGPGGIRHGFIAARLSGKDKRWMNVGATVLGPLTPHSITPDPQASGPDFRFGGGQSGGGGSSSEF